MHGSQIGGNMIYYTGDIHGSHFELAAFCRRFKLTEEDTVVLLGDVGANYYGGKRDIQQAHIRMMLRPH